MSESGVYFDKPRLNQAQSFQLEKELYKLSCKIQKANQCNHLAQHYRKFSGVEEQKVVRSTLSQLNQFQADQVVLVNHHNTLRRSLSCTEDLEEPLHNGRVIYFIL